MQMDEISRRELSQLRLKHSEEILLPKAVAGENWAKARLLLFVADGLDTGAKIPPGIAKFVSDGLRRVYTERVGEKAFGIERRRGERDTRSSATCV